MCLLISLKGNKGKNREANEKCCLSGDQGMGQELRWETSLNVVFYIFLSSET